MAIKQKAIMSIMLSNENAQGSETRLRSNPTAISEMDQLVNGKRLLEILWDAQSRPSMQWLLKQVKRRMIPFIRRGRLIFFRPRTVLEWYIQKEQRPPSMK